MALKLVSCLLLFVAAGCSAAESARGVAAGDSAARDSAAHRAHANYVPAINSNNLDTLASMLTDDVVFLAANEKPMVGKAPVRAWVDAYYKAFRTSWDKPVQEFVVSGDYAFERYSFRAGPPSSSHDEVGSQIRARAIAEQAAARARRADG